MIGLVYRKIMTSRRAEIFEACVREWDETALERAGDEHCITLPTFAFAALTATHHLP